MTSRMAGCVQTVSETFNDTLADLVSQKPAEAVRGLSLTENSSEVVKEFLPAEDGMLLEERCNESRHYLIKTCYTRK